MTKTEDLLSFLLPNYLDEGKTDLVIAVGCTGGKHRSVCIAKELFEFVSKRATRPRSAIAIWAEGDCYDGFLQNRSGSMSRTAGSRASRPSAADTGCPAMLRGLKAYTRDITAIVTVADDGGGSGMLREDLGMLPPGDIRNCLWRLPIRTYHAAAAQLPLLPMGALQARASATCFWRP